jgi:hypothetical protein
MKKRKHNIWRKYFKIHYRAYLGYLVKYNVCVHRAGQDTERVNFLCQFNKTQSFANSQPKQMATFNNERDIFLAF